MRSWALCGLLTCFLSPAQGQNGLVRHFTNEEGLIENTPFALLQDQQGKLWTGTRGGVCWYDGHHFQPLALDRVSSDQNNWMKAPMLPELQMDFIVEVGEDQYYGPTTLGAIAEFVGAGEINADTSVTNCKDRTQMRVRDILPPALLHPAPAPDIAISPRPSSIRLNLQQRIRELETALLDERRARETAEMMVSKLEVRLLQYTAAGEPVSL